MKSFVFSWFNHEIKCDGGSSAQHMEKNMKEDTSKAGQREVETRRIGLQDRLKEKVVDAKHDQSALDRARNARFAATGEPSEAPCAADVE